MTDPRIARQANAAQLAPTRKTDDTLRTVITLTDWFLSEARAGRRLGGLEKDVALVLAKAEGMNTKGETYISAATVAERAGCDVRKAKRIVAALLARRPAPFVREGRPTSRVKGGQTVVTHWNLGPVVERAPGEPVAETATNLWPKQPLATSGLKGSGTSGQKSHPISEDRISEDPARRPRGGTSSASPLGREPASPPSGGPRPTERTDRARPAATTSVVKAGGRSPLYTKTGRLRRDPHKPPIGRREALTDNPFDAATVGHDVDFGAQVDAERDREREQIVEIERLADAANARDRKRQEQAGRQKTGRGEREVIGESTSTDHAFRLYRLNQARERLAAQAAADIAASNARHARSR